MSANVPLRDTDTIVARATPPGRAGIAVVRLSGAGCRELALVLLGKLPAPRRAELHDFRGADGKLLDTGLALFFPGPQSFTGEDVLELHCHGGPVVCEMLIEATLELGARLAQPGEFSRRAVWNDKLDLNQAEAIADLIDAGSRAAARAAQRSLKGEFARLIGELNAAVTELRVYVEAAIDFPEEEIDFLDDARLSERLQQVTRHFASLEHRMRQGVLLRDGIQVVIAGKPNAGKSSLLNALAGYDAAIVTDLPGTTRDLVREQLDLDGMPVHVIDTAGLRSDPERIEAEGIRRAREQLAKADHALLVVDATGPVESTVEELRAELPAGLAYTVVRNKIDLSGAAPGPAGPTAEGWSISALTGAGIDGLRDHLKHVVGFEDPGESTIIARRRHLELLRLARAHFEAGLEQLAQAQAGELMAEELLAVQNALAEITGEFTSEDLLGEIFARFCIGK